MAGVVCLYREMKCPELVPVRPGYREYGEGEHGGGRRDQKEPPEGFEGQ